MWEGPPYRTHMQGDGLKLCCRKGLKTICTTCLCTSVSSSKRSTCDSVVRLLKDNFPLRWEYFQNTAYHQLRVSLHSVNGRPRWKDVRRSDGSQSSPFTVPFYHSCSISIVATIYRHPLPAELCKITPLVVRLCHFL